MNENVLRLNEEFFTDLVEDSPMPNIINEFDGGADEAKYEFIETILPSKVVLCKEKLSTTQQTKQKRGRKPKGGKIKTKEPDTQKDLNVITNVILHLKCSTADLNKSNFNDSNLSIDLLEYNPNIPPDIMTYNTTFSSICSDKLNNLYPFESEENTPAYKPYISTIYPEIPIFTGHQKQNEERSNLPLHATTNFVRSPSENHSSYPVLQSEYNSSNWFSNDQYIEQFSKVERKENNKDVEEFKLNSFCEDNAECKDEFFGTKCREIGTSLDVLRTSGDKDFSEVECMKIETITKNCKTTNKCNVFNDVSYSYCEENNRNAEGNIETSSDIHRTEEENFTVINCKKNGTFPYVRITEENEDRLSSETIIPLSALVEEHSSQKILTSEQSQPLFGTSSDVRCTVENEKFSEVERIKNTAGLEDNLKSVASSKNHSEKFIFEFDETSAKYMDFNDSSSEVRRTVDQSIDKADIIPSFCETKSIEHGKCSELERRNINLKIKQLKVRLYKNINQDKKSACFWCTYEFDNPSCYIPKYENDKSIVGYGSFCTPECALAHLMNESLDDSTKFERIHLLNKVYAKIYNYNKNIKPAPNPFYLLDKYYGNMTIQEYRKLLKSGRTFIVLEKPFTRFLPELHEDNENIALNYNNCKEIIEDKYSNFQTEKKNIPSHATANWTSPTVRSGESLNINKFGESIPQFKDEFIGTKCKENGSFGNLSSNTQVGWDLQYLISNESQNNYFKPPIETRKVNGFENIASSPFYEDKSKIKYSSGSSSVNLRYNGNLKDCINGGDHCISTNTIGNYKVKKQTEQVNEMSKTTIIKRLFA
jgi:hypothetical protein